MSQDSDLLKQLGGHFRQARERAGLTQEEVATRAGLSRPRYRAIEAGDAAARATNLFNIARALNLEMMPIPTELVSAVRSMLRPAEDDDQPAFVADPSEDERE
jgi:transcriptional regulator with XRE-family HTH domain